MNTLGERLRHLRGEQSQVEFGVAIGVNINTLRNYERDVRSPSADTLSEICIKTNTSPLWLLLGEGPMRLEGGSETLPAKTPNESRFDATTPSNDACGGTQEKIRELRRENTELRRECSELRTENQRLSRELSDANKDLINTSKELLQTTRENADLRVELTEIKSRAAPDTIPAEEPTRKSA
ncbi:helix-turn-helix domain-containing protein [Desulfovibrio inopinatus]|uniref:helix-turn-helix domain-containing protein n=1 Tax=Desulfovibrio inopinatus TaxID=102109 RepID=UPI00055326B1|nr:helix-turn-helix transcriptional regulator [Desulfovibrio inopinatus]